MSELKPATLPPSLAPPTQAAYADRSQSKPLFRMIARMIKPRAKSKGLVQTQNVKIKKKKVKFY